MLAFDSRNISVCYGLDGGLPRDSCCSGLGGWLNASLCEMSVDPVCRDNCFIGLADESGDAGFCGRVVGGEDRHWCYKSMNRSNSS